MITRGQSRKTAEYVEAARRLPKNDVLTLEDEQELVRRFRAGDRQAGDRLVCGCLAWVADIARQRARYGHDLDDLIQVANLALLLARDDYDPAYGVRFMTYATWKVRSRLSSYCTADQSTVNHTTKATRAQSNLKKVTREMQGAERAHVVAEVVRRSGCRPALIEALMTRHETSLDAPVKTNGGRVSVDDTFSRPACGVDQLVEPGLSPEEALLRKEEHEIVVDVVRRKAGSIRGRELVEKRILAEDPIPLAELAAKGHAKSAMWERERRILDRVERELREVLAV